MPSVQDELAALRSQSITKKNAASLKDAGPLSTPEAEQQSIQTERARKKTYSKDAEQNLQRSKTVVDQALEFSMQAGAAKKSDKKKQQEAASNLQKFNQAKLEAAGGKKVSIASAAAPAPAAPAVKPVTPTPQDTTPAPKDESESPTATTVTNDEDEEDAVPELEGVPALEDMPDMGQQQPAEAADPAPAETKINRAERKSRRMMEKLGMRPVPGIVHCTLKMRQGIFTIQKPDVFEKNGSYVIFGVARQGGGGMPNGGAVPSMREQQAQAAAQKMAMESAAAAPTPKIEELDEGALDETGVDPKDIDLVVGQAGCTRAKAVKALKDNDGDLVNAIMSLTA